MPLANERYTAGEGPLRISDRTNRDYQDWLRTRWCPIRNRELTDAEVAQRDRNRVSGTSLAPPTEFELARIRQEEGAARNARSAELERQRQAVIRQQKAKRDLEERRQQFEANEVLIEQTMTAYGLTPEEKSELTIQLGSRATTSLDAVTFACERIREIKANGGV